MLFLCNGIDCFIMKMLRKSLPEYIINILTKINRLSNNFLLPKSPTLIKINQWNNLLLFDQWHFGLHVSCICCSMTFHFEQCGSRYDYHKSFRKITLLHPPMCYVLTNWSIIIFILNILSIKSYVFTYSRNSYLNIL